MRAITEQAKQALENKTNFKKDNTEVEYSEGLAKLFLHGNYIGSIDEEGKIEFTLAGWNTPTTRERLKALGVYISIKKGQPYYHTDTGELVEIDEYYYYSA